jgi:hypothetical protein
MFKFLMSFYCSAMSNNSSKEEQVPRPRSSSTNEVSKPIAVLQRRQTHVGNSSVKGSLFCSGIFSLCPDSTEIVTFATFPIGSASLAVGSV